MPKYKIGDKVYLTYGNVFVYGEIIDNASWSQVKDTCFKVQTWFLHEDGSIAGKFLIADPVYPEEMYPTFDELIKHNEEKYQLEIDDFYEEYKGDGSLKNLLEIPFKIYEYYEGDAFSPQMEAYRKLVNEYLEDNQ